MDKNAPRAELPAEVLSLLEVFREPAVLLSADYRIVAANRAYQLEHGQSGALHKRHCYEVSHRYSRPCDQEGESCPLKRSRETNEPQRELHVHHSPRGQEHVDVEVFPICGPSGGPELFLEVIHASRLTSPNPRASGLVGRSKRFNEVVAMIQRAAPSDVPVLLLGESGTGKELVAQAIHESSPRAKGPFVPVGCSGLTEALFESELFGYERGAFSGAQNRKLGLVEVARGGTLFLDEIGDVPPVLQMKLLRLLESGTYRRVGGTQPQKADFRLVCATHQDLKQMVKEGSFRRDLYYRISAFPLLLPPLVARMEDLPLLVESLLQRIAPGRSFRLDSAATACLRGYDFPGNVRELRNILERAVLLTDGDVIHVEHLPEECSCPGSEGMGSVIPSEIVPLEEMERVYLAWALTHFDGDKRLLAKRLGVSERTLYRKLHDLRHCEDEEV